MNRLTSLLRQREFSVWLFFVSLILFGRPLVEYSDVGLISSMFVYLFVAWALVIVILFFRARSLDATKKNGTETYWEADGAE